MTKKQICNSFNVAKSFQGTDRISREGGERFRQEILRIWERNQFPIVMNFMYEPIASVTFWDEGIAKLLEVGWTKNEIKDRLKFRNMHGHDEEIIKELIKDRE